MRIIDIGDYEVQFIQRDWLNEGVTTNVVKSRFGSRKVCRIEKPNEMKTGKKLMRC